MDAASTYFIRTNHNGTFDAICKGCLATSAAYVRAKEDLERWHSKHRCDGLEALTLRGSEPGFS